jgi:hypothetical protein
MEEDKIKIKHLEQRVEILEFSMKRMKNQIEYLMEVAPPRKKSGKSKIDIDTWKEIFKSRNFFTPPLVKSSFMKFSNVGIPEPPQINTYSTMKC